MAQCIREGHDESPFVSLQCRREAVYKGYCRSCAWVMLPDERELLPEKVKRAPRPRAEQKETPWAATLLKPFTTWKIRKAWPVGSVLVRRNTVGMHKLPNGGRIKYGLGVGTADYVGFKSVLVTKEMVGKRVAIFTSLEAKREKKELSDNQQLWHEMILLNGGISMKFDPKTKEDVLSLLNSKEYVIPTQ